MKIGIFGGSFNPPHKMHEDMAKFLLDGYVNKIIFVPTGIYYEYKNNLLSNEHRYNMVKLITDKYECMDVSNFEMKDEVVYTYQTLDYFKLLYPDDEIYFVCGSDNLSYIDKWKRGDYLLKEYKYLVIDRNTNRINDLLEQFQEHKNNIIPVSMELNDLSSTYIRNNVNDKTKLERYLDKDVLKYINENNLYR